MKSGILEKNILTKEALFLRLRLATIELVQNINTADYDSHYKNLSLSSKQNQCMYEDIGSKYIILPVQVSSHDFEPRG